MTQCDARPDLSQLVRGARLPALPQSAIRLLELSRDSDCGPAEFATPIESDPGLTGQVLRFVNSSYFGLRHEVASVKLAISLVGVRTIRNFALWSAVFSLVPNPKCGPFDLRSLWQDSLRRGIFARIFGRILGLRDVEDLFAAALLQDMALPLLAKELPVHYQQFLDQRNRETRRLSALEREEFGWTHAEAGGMLARYWSLPESFACMVQAHVGSDGALDTGGLGTGTAAVVLSGRLPSTCDDSWSERERFAEMFSELAGSAAPPLAKVLEHVDREFDEFAPVLKIASPERRLAEYLNEQEVLSR